MINFHPTVGPMQKTRLLLFEMVSMGIAFAVLGSAHDALANSVWVTSVAHQCATAPDDTVRISVMLEDNLDPIDDDTLFVSRHGHSLSFVSAERGHLIAGWTGFSAVEGLGGQITIEVSNAEPIQPGTSGELVRLQFTTDCCEGLYNSPFPETIKPSGLGDFAPPMALVEGKYLCAMERPGMLYVENGFTICDGVVATARVDVMLVDTTVPVDNGGLDVLVSGYYGGVLTYAGYERGDLTADWDTFDVSGGNIGDTSSIRISASNSEALPPGTTGTFVTILYQANCCAASGSGYSAIEPLLLTGDLAGFNVEYGRWYCAPVGTRPSTWGYVKTLYR